MNTTPSQNTSPSPAVLDPSIVNELRGLLRADEPDFLQRSVQLFDQRTHACEVELVNAVVTMDRDELRRAAHALAGSAAIVGASQLHDRALALEINPQLSWADVSRVLGGIHDACEVARRALRDEICPEEIDRDQIHSEDGDPILPQEEVF